MSRSGLFDYFKILLFSLIVSIPLILPYFKTGYFPTDDGEWAVIRLSEMYREVKDFQLPARYSTYLNFQYGYPLFNYTYPMPYYLGIAPVVLKFGFVNTIKLLFASSVVLSFFSMFLLSKSLWKSNFAAFIGGFFYIYVPYRMVDLYVRGSLGESLSFILFPLVLLGIKKIYDIGKPRYVLASGLFFAFLITMHNIMAVLMGVFILFIFIASIIKKNYLFALRLAFSIFYALGLSAFFWLPALGEKNLILLSKIPIEDRNLYYVNLLQLITPRWGYGAPIFPGGFTYQVGVPQLLVLISAIIVSAIKNKTKEARIAIFVIISALLMGSLMFPFSAFIWEHTPLLKEINYPWTILSMLMLFTSLLAGYLAKQAKFLMPLFMLCVLSFIIIFSYANPKSYVDKGDGYYLTNQGTTTSSNELMPLWVKKQPLEQPKEKIENLNGNEKINLIFSNSNTIIFNTVLEGERLIQINTIYFPGWVLSVNGVKTKIEYDKLSGVMQVRLNKGENNIKLNFKDTPLRIVSNLISLISVIFLALEVILYKLKKIKI